MNQNALMIRSKLILLALVLALFPPMGNAAETKYGIGFGAQFGGVAGLQLSQEIDGGISKVGVGFLGYSVGHERFISPNISLGAQLFHLTLVRGFGLNMNYYIGSRHKQSLVLGVELSSVKIFDGFMGVPADSETLAHFSVGYRF